MKTKLILTLASFFTALGGASGEDLYYLYNGQRIPLVSNPAKMAVKLAPAVSGEAASSAAVAAATQGQALGLDSWRLVELPISSSSNSASVNPEAVNAATADAARVKATEPGVTFATPVFDLGDGMAVFPTSSLLVQFKAGVKVAETIDTLQAQGVTSASQVGSSGIYELQTTLTDGAAAIALANLLASHPAFASAEPSFVQLGSLQWTPNDPLFSQAWGLRNTGQSGGQVGFDLGATAAWDLTRGSSSVIVVVFECGIQPDHPDLNTIAGRDFTDSPIAGAGPRPTGNTNADNHGTWVGGIISSRANNGIGAVGIAPDCRIASARIGVPTSGNSFSAPNLWIIAALDWARSIGARVTNHSYTMGAPSSAIDTALQNARNAGIVNFAATGNANSSTIGYPASSPYCLAVGAANRHGSRASFSNYGPGLDFIAPGEDVITTDRTGSMGIPGDYATVSGTSFASPYAAGLAALIISRNPSWTAAQVEARMRSTCRDLGAAGYDTVTGHGLLNAANALGVTTVPSDDHGNTAATATNVIVPSLTAGSLDPATDEDWFRFSITVASTVTISTESSMDTYGHLHDSAGARITFDDDSGANLNFQITTALNPGTYFVRVHSFGFGSTGSYNLRISTSVAASPRMLVRGNGVIIADGDTTPSGSDHTAFGTVNTGTSVTRVFSVANTGNASLTLTGSPRVSLSGGDTSSFQVTVNPASPMAAGASSSFTIRYAPASAGSHTAVVSIQSNDSSTSPYTFTLSGTGQALLVDDHGNTRKTATRINLNTLHAGALERVGDVDFFRFTLTSRTRVQISSSSPTNLDLVANLLNAAGRSIAFSDDDGGNMQFSITRTLKRGTYFVRVRGYKSSVAGSYTLSLSSL